MINHQDFLSIGRNVVQDEVGSTIVEYIGSSSKTPSGKPVTFITDVQDITIITRSSSEYD